MWSQAGRAVPDSSAVIHAQEAVAWRVALSLLRDSPQECSFLSCVPTIKLVHPSVFLVMQWPALHFGEPLHTKIYCTVEKRKRPTSLNLSSLGEPFVESHSSEPCVLFGNECAFGHLYAVVSRLRVSDNFSRILACGQTLPDKFIEAELFGPP
jgi:hypothetical protein